MAEDHLRENNMNSKLGTARTVSLAAATAATAVVLTAGLAGTAGAAVQAGTVSAHGVPAAAGQHGGSIRNPELDGG
jgi:hypothetical protein